MDLDSLQLKLYAEFDTWKDFVDAVDQFQRVTSIKLTITTSRKLKSRPSRLNRRQKRRSSSSRPIKSGNGQEESIDSSGDGINDEDSQEDTNITINGFEYQYLKLTCKHFGGYRSTSKGIRPNQKTAKLECPTYIYACFDHYKQKFIIKQMVVNCNHELRDEHVLISKLFKSKDDNVSSDNGEPTPKKKYVKVRNRNVLKIPLESPVSNYAVPPHVARIKCNHELSETCEAASLTVEDLHSIRALFDTKPRKEQNDLILEYIEVLPYGSNTVQVSFRLPAFDGHLIRVCYKAFSQVLKVSISRVNELIRAHYNEEGTFVKNKDPREVDSCINNILTSYSKEGDTEETHQIYCDTVDVPYNEDTIEESFVEENLGHNNTNPNSSTNHNTNSNNNTNPSSNANSTIESSSSLRNEARNTVHLLNPLKPPVIKVSPSGDKFSLEINCEYSVTLQNVSIENNGKTIKVAFSAK